MAKRSRTLKVLSCLVASMTVGAIVLLAFEKRPLPAGAFSLASYTNLSSIEQVTASGTTFSPGRWNRVEIFYSKTKAGNVKQIASLRGLVSDDDVNFHFLVCNGRGSGNGQIQTSEKWRRQWSCVPGGMWYGSGETIRICVVADEKGSPPTDCQMKRTAELVEEISRKFQITPESIFYPEGWQL